MPNLSESQLGTVRALIQAAPDRAIRDLETALASSGDRHESMRLIHSMVNAEAIDRRTRYVVLAPLAPLCAPRPPDAIGLSFPPSAIVLIWRALKEQEPREVQEAAALVCDPEPDELAGLMFNTLCRSAAAGLRARANAGYEAAAAALERASPGAAESFAQCLDLTPVARTVLEQLPDWLGRMTEDRAIAARLAFKDAVLIAEDAGPRLLEILYAHLEEPWLILRLMSVLMHRPPDRYAAVSELASFGERLMKDIDARLKRISTMDATGGAAAGVAAGRDVCIAAQMIAEFDKALDLSPDGPWGQRLTQQKRSLAQNVEGRLRGIDREIAAVLPLQSAGFNRRGVRPQPRVTEDLNSRLVEQTRAFLAFMHEVRNSADRLGFGSTWTKASEGVQIRLDTYVEDLIDRLHAREEGDDADRIRSYLDLAAEFLGLATDDKAAQIVRRRVAAA